MKKYIALLLCILLLTTGCATSGTTFGMKSVQREKKQYPPEDFIPEDVMIVSLGDSLTQGVGGDDEEGGYIPFLKEKLEQLKAVQHAHFENYGVRGNRTDQLLKRLNKPEVKAAIKEADTIIITIGGNDVMQVFKDNLLGLKIDKFVAAESDYRDRLNKILTFIRQHNDKANLLLVGIYNPFIKWFSDIKEMDQIVNNWNEASREVIAKYERTTFVPVADIFENNEESLLYTDYFHPNSQGYERIAERIYTYMLDAGYF